MPLFDDIIAQLHARDPLPPLYPTSPWNPDLSRQITASSDNELLPGSADGTMLAACHAGLLLWNDDLDASHHISQGLENATGSFWHAIMHRREGDASNANYWWRRTSAHPAFGAVCTAVLDVLDEEDGAPARNFAALLRRTGTWAPVEFTARCSAARGDDAWLRRVQVAEMATLLEWCRVKAL